MKNISSLEKVFYLSLLLLVLGFGLYIRFDDVKVWKQNENLFFYKGEPLYSEADSFYFARYALEWKEGLFKSGEIDPLRFFPDNSSQAKLSEELDFRQKYAISGTFISYIFYVLSEITGKSVAWLSYYLIPFLAVSVSIVLYFYFSNLNMPYVGLLAGLITVSSPIFLARTSLMRLDHDVLNLTLPFLIAYFFLKFFHAQTKRSRYTYITLASLTLILYHLWYAHPNLNFVLILTFFLAYFWSPLKGFILHRRWNYSFSKDDLIIFAILILPQIWYLYAGPYYLYYQVKTLVFNIKSPTSAEVLFKDFPNIFMSINELQKMNFWAVLSSIIYNKVFGIVGLIGAFLLILFHFRRLLPLLPFFGIGILAFVSGIRFAMYLAPFIGMGLGYWVYLLFKNIFPLFHIFEEERKQKTVIGLVGFAIFVTTLMVQVEALGFSSAPVVTSPVVKNMEWLKENTPKNAVIWTWWDYGYVFQFYSRRATFHDGGSQWTPKTYLIARSFTTSNPREAWLITSFVSNHGLTGLAKLLKEGKSAKDVVEEIKSGKYYQPIKTPIYWVFTNDLIPKFEWIHYFGSYDFDKKEGILGKITVITCKLRFSNSNLIQCEELSNVSIDLENGYINVSNKISSIKHFYYRDEKGLSEKEFFKQGLTVEVVKRKDNKANIFILESPFEKTLFNEMFLLRKYDPRYFELVLDDFPYMVIYKVKPEIDKLE